MVLIKLANKKQIEKFQERKTLRKGISIGWNVEEQKDQVKYRNKSLQCESCSSNFSIPKDLFIHSMRVHHEGWSYVDETQSEKSNNFQNLDEDPKGPFECDLCTEVHKSWGSLVKHLWTPHLFECEYCKLNFTRKTTLDDHVNNTHNIVGLIDSTECGLCGETFGRSTILARHVSTPHKFPCNQCKKAFTSKALLKKHEGYCIQYQIFRIIEKCMDNIIY